MDLHEEQGVATPSRVEDTSTESALHFDIATRVQAVADIAAGHAREVDRDASFPAAAIAAAKRNGLMALLVPRDLGRRRGVHACRRRCLLHARSGLRLYGNDRRDAPGRARLHRAPLRGQRVASRDAAAGRRREPASRLLDHRGKRRRAMFARRPAPLVRGGQPDRLRTRRDGHVLRHRGRRHRHHPRGARWTPRPPTRRSSLFLKPDYKLTPTGSWDTLGMRGTSSAGFALAAEADAAQILPVGYDKIHPQTMGAGGLASRLGPRHGRASRRRRCRALRASYERRRGAPAARCRPGRCAAPRPRRRCRAYAASSPRWSRATNASRPTRAHSPRSRRRAALNLFKVDVSERAVDTVMLAMPRLRPGRLPQRRRLHARPPPARRALRTDHGSQRAHPRQHRDDRADERRAVVAHVRTREPRGTGRAWARHIRRSGFQAGTRVLHR